MMHTVLQILHEDNDILIVNKPSGLLVHGDGHGCEESLADFLIDTGKVGKEVGEPLVVPLGKGVAVDCALPSHEYDTENLTIYRPGIVHRLDKDTSGVMIVAKNMQSFLSLKKQFQDRTVKKEYVAIVRGTFKENIGSMSHPIGRSKNDFRKWLSGKGTRGELRDAVTDYRVMKTFRTDDGIEWSMVSVRPRTGRTHQIRVHMTHESHPIAGDTLYADERAAKAFPRLMLHAAKITILDLAGKTVSYEAPLPDEFKV